MKMILTCLIRFYQVSLSHIFGGCCRFYPTCSEYALQAIMQHGSLKGSVLGMGRLCRCHPFHSGGFDPVPAPDDGKKRGCAGTTGDIYSNCEVMHIP
ncbi:MAG: membrane protein insertion efficiency factor YidD [bacterium]